MVKVAQPAKATARLLSEVHRLILENDHLQFHPNEIRNNMSYAVHRMEILDCVAFVRFAQPELLRLGAVLQSIASHMEEYFSGTMFTSLQKMKASEDAVLMHSAECKHLLHSLHMHDHVRKGHFLRISCPHMAALWCDRLGNAESAACENFDQEIATILQAGVFGFPLKVETAGRIAQLISHECDGCLSADQQRHGVVTPAQVEHVMSGCDLATLLDTYYAIAEPNYKAVRDLYQSTAGSKWSKSNKWLQCEDMNQWHGITMEGNKIKEINLFNNKLKGRLPIAIANLVDVIYVNCAMNGIIGKMPEQIGQLQHLVELSLDKNKLMGHIPHSIGRCKALRKLSLRQNGMSGVIPDAL